MTTIELQHARALCSELIEQRTRKVDAMATEDNDGVERLFIETGALGAAIAFLTDGILHAEIAVPVTPK